MSANKQQCQASYAIQVPGPHGYLSSAVTAETGCGTSYHPWVIEVDPTQRVNITLYDFSALAGNQRTPPGVCQEFAVIKEENSRSIVVSVRKTLFPLCITIPHKRYKKYKHQYNFCNK